MQNEANVYAAPKADLTGSGAPGDISPEILEKLRKTRPWVLLIAILLLISAVLMVLGGISAIIGFAGSFLGQEAGLPVALGVGLGVGYLIGAVIYLFLGVYLLKYSGAIKRSTLSRSSADVAAAIGHQHAFWRLAGILTLVAIVFMVVTAVIGVVGGIAGGMMAH